jgi:hypothetical protein
MLLFLRNSNKVNERKLRLTGTASYEKKIVLQPASD